MPKASEQFLESFARLPPDVYAPTANRFRRFSQFRLSYKHDRWSLNRLPHRPLIQARAYNQVAGNLARHFEPLECDPSLFVDSILRAAKLDTCVDWHLDVNQYRVIANEHAPGICVPEGIHRDGHQFVKIMVFRRQRISGAELTLYPLDADEPFFTRIIEEGQAIVIDDTRMRHYATDISAIARQGGYRDYIGTCLNRWDERKYGPEFEANALAG